MYNVLTMPPPKPIPLLVIAGPTATGKTAAAVEIATSHDGEIVSADSMQVYRDLDVGTAKPTPEELAQARFHLVDYVDPFASYTAADFQRDARGAIADIAGRGKLPILCGGTGLYVRAVLGGLSFPPGAIPETTELRQKLQEEAQRDGIEVLHERLRAVDPTSAKRLPPGDARRIIRALEVHAHTGRPFSELARVDESPEVIYNAATLVLSCPRELLYQRIEQRVDLMMAAGWLAEVEALRRRGLTTAHQCMQAIGYRHLLRHVEHEGDLAEIVSLIKRDTRRFAKRQFTWFGRESAIVVEWGPELPFAAAVQTLSLAASQLREGGDRIGE